MNISEACAGAAAIATTTTATITVAATTPRRARRTASAITIFDIYVIFTAPFTEIGAVQRIQI